MAQIEAVLFWRYVLLGLLLDSWDLSIGACCYVYELVNHLEFGGNSKDLPRHFLIVIHKLRHLA